MTRRVNEQRVKGSAGRRPPECTAGPGSADTSSRVSTFAAPFRALKAPFASPLFDPGWLFLVAGVVLMAFTLLIPAFDDVETARHNLRRMQAVEGHRLDRLTNYHRYLEALDRGDEALVLSLAAIQLNKAPVGRALLVPGGDIAKRSASVFGGLEPPPLVLPERLVQRSTLETWAMGDRSRLLLIGFAGLCLLIGILPPSRAA